MIHIFAAERINYTFQLIKNNIHVPRYEQWIYLAISRYCELESRFVYLYLLGVQYIKVSVCLVLWTTVFILKLVFFLHFKV